MGPKKAIIGMTLGSALLVFSVASSVQITKSHTKVAVETKSFPSIGRLKAPVEVVLIEDFQCKNCREFSRKVLPKLQREYVKEGEVRFTLIPVSFLAGPQSIANAVLEVYDQNPRQFFPFLKDILDHEGEMKTSDLLRFAKRVKGINLEKFENCIKNGCHNKELVNNLNWAQKVMGSRFRTPTLYVNGAVGSTYSYEAIQYQIDQILGGK